MVNPLNVRMNVRKSPIAVAGLVALSCAAVAVNAVCLTGCSSRIQPSENLSNVGYGENVAQTVTAGQVNMAEEQAVADGVLKAWRNAIASKKAGKDESEAMKMLCELDEAHPNISTVQLMMGQVKDHFGKPKDALEHYKKAHSVNEFSSLQTFKLAESMRKAGDFKGAIPHYKRLVGNLEKATEQYGHDDFKALLISVRLGLARALKEEGSDMKAAEEQIKKSLELDPNSADAKALQAEFEAAAKTQLLKTK